ncbi:acetyl-CoA carboxylase carboxyltransferase subunit alpha [Chloroflexus sp.]|uniref:acetyl-CoA carboxylase carboxyltransferase subunit alpha n=1 Tax=Chloroflexus sp. TaxID=1904827 RepID=UPI003A0FE718
MEETPLQQTMTPWDRVQLARHPQRPHTLDYIAALCEDFVELHGDRRFGDDPAMVGGMATFAGQTVMVIGHQKGNDTRENMRRNFGMPHPEGYRKAQRLMRHAEKFGLPVICFVDTPAADPTKSSEERGQANAIAESIMLMTTLRVPSIAVVIGEGGSGGALAISVADRILMQENSIYSVAPPEAAASILWRDAAKAPEAAKALKLTAADLFELRIIDEVIPEPPGGAHTDRLAAITAVGERLRFHLADLQQRDLETMLRERYQKYRSMGQYQEQQMDFFARR